MHHVITLNDLAFSHASLGPSSFLPFQHCYFNVLTVSKKQIHAILPAECRDCSYEGRNDLKQLIATTHGAPAATTSMTTSGLPRVRLPCNPPIPFFLSENRLTRQRRIFAASTLFLPYTKKVYLIYYQLSFKIHCPATKCRTLTRFGSAMLSVRSQYLTLSISEPKFWGSKFSYTSGAGWYTIQVRWVYLLVVFSTLWFGKRNAL